MDDKKGKSSNRKWIVYVVVICLVSTTIIGIGVYFAFNLIVDSDGIAYTWTDRSSGECEVIEGTYYGKSDTLYLHDDLIDAFCSARFHYTTLTEGSILFYFRYDSNTFGADITMEFYEFTTMFSTLDHVQVSLMSDTWYLIELTFDCVSNSGEVWVDGILITTGSFTISDSDGNDGFVIRTNDAGRINAYLNMVSITG